VFPLWKRWWHARREAVRGVPNANQCKPLQFAEVGGLGGAATGSICRDALGDTFILHYTYHSCHTRSDFETATCRFSALHDLPTSGTCRGTANQAPFVDPTVILEACNVSIPGASQISAGNDRRDPRAHARGTRGTQPHMLAIFDLAIPIACYGVTA